MILTLFVSMALTLVIGIYTVEKLKKKKIEQSERHDGPQSHLIKEGTPTSGGIMCYSYNIRNCILCFPTWNTNRTKRNIYNTYNMFSYFWTCRIFR